MRKDIEGEVRLIGLKREKGEREEKKGREKRRFCCFYFFFLFLFSFAYKKLEFSTPPKCLGLLFVVDSKINIVDIPYQEVSLTSVVKATIVTSQKVQ